MQANSLSQSTNRNGQQLQKLGFQWFHNHIFTIHIYLSFLSCFPPLHLNNIACSPPFSPSLHELRLWTAKMWPGHWVMQSTSKRSCRDCLQRQGRLQKRFEIAKLLPRTSTHWCRKEKGFNLTCRAMGIKFPRKQSDLFYCSSCWSQSDS